MQSFLTLLVSFSAFAAAAPADLFELDWTEELSTRDIDQPEQWWEIYARDNDNFDPEEELSFRDIDLDDAQGLAARTHSFTHTFNGDKTGKQYTPPEKWKDFESMWKANLPLIAKSCAQYGPVNTASENEQMKKAIEKVAAETKGVIPPSAILASVMQESKGCVRVHSTKSWEGVLNPGLMQTHKGEGSCNSNIQKGQDKSKMKTPCPAKEIEQMIRDGVFGTKHDKKMGLLPKLTQMMSKYKSETKNGKATAVIWARMLRAYNSGDLDVNIADLSQTKATKDYVLEWFNRVSGWVG